MKAAIIRFPGTNRERDMRLALLRASGAEPVMVWHKDSALPPVDLIVLPGGFAHGDHLRAGAIAARAPAMRAVAAAAARGVPVLGVCNGFQALTEAGLLPGALLRNAGLRFICRPVGLRVETGDSIFTAGYRAGQRLSIPVANNDGNYFADPETLDRLEDEDRIAFRYAGDPEDGGDGEDPGNPGGSARAIAGILDRGRRVLGIMPHPENAVDPALGGSDGSALFDGLVRALS